MTHQRRRDPIETRKRILSAAFRLFNQHLLIDLNSNHIAKEAGVAVGSFYKYFDSKESVFLACYADWVKTEWDAIHAVIAKPVNKKTVGQVISLLLEEHRRAFMFRKNLNALCILSEPAQIERDRQRLHQCTLIAQMMLTQKNPPPPLPQLQTALNTCEFLLDVWSNNRQKNLGLTVKDLESQLGVIIDGLLRAQPTKP
ncbi:TetR/AcrR family transcriptional regulator [Limnobacter humi]|uniref:TetR/AcrR family transcriptional regulator n=2 Tax=Limnobacter humi TaxID=1778671 RepID=A0ABT1WG45_9BURK|nr:TetR/AcrR family transcriptional regulator [Limnobacter humi]